MSDTAASLVPTILPLAAAANSMAAVLLVLCVVAAVGTILVLPGRREAAFRKVGGVILVTTALIFLAMLIRYAAGSPDASRGGMGAYFWIFSAIAVAAAMRVITHPRPVYSALYFVLTVMASAGLFILLSAEFMAAALVIIYAGAILVTYVFVIMLASQTAPAGNPRASTADSTPTSPIAEYDNVSREPVVAAAVGFTLAGILLHIIFDLTESFPKAAGSPMAMPQGMTFSLGQYLFTSQVLTLELAGVILTLAMVGAIVIARRQVVHPDEVETESNIVEETIAPATPVDDNPHSIPVYGTDNPRAKAYPEA